MTFPEELDLKWFREEYRMPTAQDEEVIRFFYEEGMEKGHAGCALCHLKQFADWLNDSFASKRSLEIGPGAVPRLKGANVRYFDLGDSEKMREWSLAHHYSPANVPETIHFVSETGDLGVMAGETFGLIYSCHNIEHVVDLIKYINTVHGLLENGGVFACSVPDKNYTFDYFRHCSTLADVIGQFLERPDAKTHPLAVLLENHLFHAHNAPARHWAGEHGQPLHPSENLGKVIAKYKDRTKYYDAHRWVFTHQSFRDLMNDLFNLGFIKLKLARCYNTPLNANGFNALFVKGKE